MRIFGFGDVSGVYNYLKSKIFEKKKKEEEEELFFEEEITSPTVQIREPAIASFTPEAGEDTSDEQVLYIKWPLRASMFMSLKQGDSDQKSKGVWTPGEGDAAQTPADEADVLQIPDVINVPVLSPVMQDEQLMNVDILTGRGIFIGLSPIDLDWLIETADNQYLPRQEEKEEKTAQPIVVTAKEPVAEQIREEQQRVVKPKRKRGSLHDVEALMNNPVRTETAQYQPIDVDKFLNSNENYENMFDVTAAPMATDDGFSPHTENKTARGRRKKKNPVAE